MNLSSKLAALLGAVLFCCVCLPREAEAAVTVAAQVIRREAGTGECQISSGFPLPPGLVSEEIIRNGSVRVLVNGTEVAANISALRGRHSDGTLRAMLIQFRYPLAKDEVIPAQVIVSETVRTYPDPAYVRPTRLMVENNNVILPVDKDYMVSTRFTLRNLLKEGDGSAAEEKFYTALAENRFDDLSIDEIDGTAEYEQVSAMLSLWVRLGDAKFQKEAVKKTLLWLGYNTPRATGDDPNYPCRARPFINPDNRTETDMQACALPSEWNFSRVFSYAQMYLLTGYRDFWALVAYFAQWEQGENVTNQAEANSNTLRNDMYDYPRANYAGGYGSMIPALIIDATMPISGEWFDARAMNWENQLEWTVNAIINQPWDLRWLPFDSGSGSVPAGTTTTISRGGASAVLLGVYSLMTKARIATGQTMPATGYLQLKNLSGTFSAGALTGIGARATGPDQSDYRAGLVGTRSNSPRDYTNEYFSNSADVPIFQNCLPANFLIDYYLYVKKDSRIPAVVKKILDITLTNVRPMVPGDTYYGRGEAQWGYAIYGNPYFLQNPPSTADAPPYELPEFARLCAFVLKTLGDATVNGAAYSTWYNRLIDTANFNPNIGGIGDWQWKNFGQFYGWGQDAPWMMKQASLADYGPSTMRVPVQWDAIPGDTPDIGRENTHDSVPPAAPANLHTE